MPSNVPSVPTVTYCCVQYDPDEEAYVSYKEGLTEQEADEEVGNCKQHGFTVFKQAEQSAPT